MAFSVSHGEENPGKTLPRHITMRRGTANDEFATFDVMRRTMNYEMHWSHHGAMRQHLRTSPHASFWLAEETPRFGSPRVIGYARSVIRDRVWHLTEFFVLPNHHKQGIGSALLKQCLADGEAAGADTHLVLASQHPGADALYLRLAGCIPRLPMMLLAGPLTSLKLSDPASAHILDPRVPPDSPALTASAETPDTLIAEPLILTPEIHTALDALDRDIVGYARPNDHVLWESEMGGARGASRLFRRKTAGFPGDAGSIVGYAYLGPHSSGPALALAPNDLPRMITHVAAIARRSVPRDFPLLQPLDHYWAMAGINEVMLRWLLGCGWQIVFQYLFMSSRPLGRLDRYVCHNPLYLP